MVAQRFAHAHHAIGARQNAHHDPDIGQHIHALHQLAPSGDDVEQLVRATDLHIGAHVVGVISLH